MVEWFEIEKLSREVLRVDRGGSVPADTATLKFVETTPQSLRRYQKQRRSADDVSADGVPVAVLYSAGDFVLRKGVVWISVDKASSRVTGTVRSSKARQPPPDDASTSFVSVSEAQEETLLSLREQAKAAGRSVSEIEWDGAILSLPSDSRQRYRVESDASVVDVGSAVMLTVTALSRNGSIDTGANGQRIVVLSGRRLKLNFASGIATRPLVGRENGFISFTSDNNVQLESSLNIEVVE